MGASFRRLYLVLTWAMLIQYAAPKGTIDLLFKEFHGNGHDSDNRCCDFAFICAINACDPYFKICIDHIGGSNDANDCNIKGPLQSQARHEVNYIQFGSFIDQYDHENAIDNPILMRFGGAVPNDIYVKVKVLDTDPVNHDDLLGYIQKQIRGMAHGQNYNRTDYKTFTTGPDQARLTLGIRSYCDKHYYGNTCVKYCKDNEGGGHYWCSSDGDKVCHIGWKGDNCDVDMNECVFPNKCKNGGTCQNMDGGYKCLCSEDFKGVDCETANHTCAINPCLNGGSCNGNQTHFTCDCLPWWGGVKCESEVDPCATSPCQNGASCVPNKISPPGYTCNYPSFITLLGIIDNSNYYDLVDGLRELIRDLGGVPGDVDVRIKPKYIPIRDGVDTTSVEFTVTVDGNPLDKRIIDEIFDQNDDDTINSYLPLPLYRPSFVDPEKRVQEKTWAADNWYIFLVIGLAVLVLLVIILAFLVSRRRKDKQNSFMRSDSNVEQTQHTDMAFENVLYHETHRNRHSDAVDGGTVTFNPSTRQQAVQHGACGEDPYSQPVQYDTPVKQPACAPNGVRHYMNSNLASLDTRCEAGANDYTMFSDLDGAQASPVVENPYQELDDVQAQKAAIAVGFPLQGTTSTDTVDESESEDEIDRIKAQIRREEQGE